MIIDLSEFTISTAVFFKTDIIAQSTELVKIFTQECYY